MWAWNRSIGSKLSRRTLASKLTPPVVKAAVLEHRVHALRGEIDIGRELVGVPAEEHVAGVGVDRAKHARAAGDFHFVLHRVAGERGVVGFEIQLQVVDETVLAEEVAARRRVGIVLMLGRLLGLGLDVELAGEADLLGVVDGHVQELREMLELALHVRVPQVLVAFAAAPERVALPPPSSLVTSSAFFTCAAANANASQFGLVAAPCM